MLKAAGDDLGESRRFILFQAGLDYFDNSKFRNCDNRKQFCTAAITIGIGAFQNAPWVVLVNYPTVVWVFVAGVLQIEPREFITDFV